jgi:hypothetical protein
MQQAETGRRRRWEKRIGPQEFWAVLLASDALCSLCFVEGEPREAIAPSDGELISSRVDEQSVVDGDDK